MVAPRLYFGKDTWSPSRLVYQLRELQVIGLRWEVVLRFNN